LNDMSFLTINTMISISVPGVAQLLLSVLYNLIFVDILYTDDWLIKMFYGDEVEMLDVDALNIYFEDCGV
jgi:hypothetical protein